MSKGKDDTSRGGAARVAVDGDAERGEGCRRDAVLPRRRGRTSRASLWLSTLCVAVFASVLLPEHSYAPFDGAASVMSKRSPPANPEPDDFAYDREEWERRVPRIVVLAGPHKTASSDLQTFVANLTAAGANARATGWQWPVDRRAHVPFRPPNFRGKFYAPLAAFVSGRRIARFFPRAGGRGTSTDRAAWRARVVQYFRRLFRGVLQEGRNVVIGAEAFDGLIMGLPQRAGAGGEDAHVARNASLMLDALLDVFPWDNGTTATVAWTPLRPEDIEVHVHYRTPRTTHLRSLWHQADGAQTFREYLAGEPPALYQSNSLALALQFARRGLKTTLVDMEGVVEKEARDGTARDVNATVVGGLHGVVACDVLRLGRDAGLCDEEGRLHLPPGRTIPHTKNQKEDRHARDLTQAQLRDIERAYGDYDCDVWRYLRRYQAKGTLRVLYPATGRFAACRFRGSAGTSFGALEERIRAIAGEGETPVQAAEKPRAQRMRGTTGKINSRTKQIQKEKKVAKEKRRDEMIRRVGMPNRRGVAAWGGNLTLLAAQKKMKS